jgi:SNF2 family DNA or RNA helicase
MNAFSVVGAKITFSSNGQIHESTVLELWQAKASDPEAYANIRILEKAWPQIHLDLDDESKAQLNVVAIADTQIFNLGSKRPEQLGYFVSGNVVVPLRQERFEALFDELESLRLPKENMQPEVLASQILKISTQRGFRVVFQTRFKSFLENLPASPVEANMSLPLWKYQQDGLSWMYRLWQNKLGGILGDEMGVGKTLQLLALACVVSEQANGRPALVVVPGNLLLKWCADFVKFAANYSQSVHVHNWSDRNKSTKFLSSQKIILTTYSMLVEDQSYFADIEFSVICCDEAHELKEWRTLKSQAVSVLNSQAKFLASGTPIQNKLLDYWTLFNIVEPGMLGSREWFEAKGKDTPEEARQLMEQTKHRILRRTQEQVELQIPEGLEIFIPLELEPELFSEYQEIERGESPIAFGNKGFGTVPARRQFCSHPASYLEDSVPNLGSKATYLLNEIEMIISVKEKAVVFVADFNRPLDLYLNLVNNEFQDLWTGVIDGRTPLEYRFHTLEEFNSQPDSAVLFVNPQVGGQGLDIVSANHVFHMNPAWNPAKTDQATFRVTRPGQTRKTYSHHLFFVDTIEERIQELVQNKREVTEAALEIAEQNAKKHIEKFDSIFNAHY